MKLLGCLARTQGDIEAEFAEFSSKAGSVDASVMVWGTVNLMIEPTGSFTGSSRVAAMRQPWHP